MCGRYAIQSSPEAMRRLFGYEEKPNFPPRYNIAPTQPVPVVLAQNGAPHFRLMRWGFLPGWVKDPKSFPLVINIRAETAATKPSFRNALSRRRCLMPADGFYEWRRAGATSTPYLFRRPDRGLFAFAALWESYCAPDGSEIDTAALVSGPANGLMAAIHERCPVILDPRDHALWLDPATEPERAQALLKPPPDDLLEMIAVSNAVNKVANDGPELQEPAAEAAPRREPPRRDPQGSLF